MSARGGNESPALPRLLLHGLDSLYVSYFLDTASGAMDWEELAWRKERARNRREELAELILGSERFALMPYGKKPYTYVMGNRAFEVRMAERMQPSHHVQFFSEALWTEGADALHARFGSWCASLDLATIRPEKVARADWAFDYHLPAPDFDIGCFVTRAAKDATHREHGKVQTFRMGQGDVVVRVYDKTAEIEQQSGKSWFFELWGHRDCVWRIEFQVRRARLKEAGIRTLAELHTLQADLLRELATHHTTLRVPSSDSNRARWPLHPLWRRLLDDIDAMPQTGLVRALDPQNELSWRQAKQLKMLYGYLKGLGAVRGLIEERNGPPDLPELIAALPELLAAEHAPALWRADIEQRMTAYRYGKW